MRVLVTGAGGFVGGNLVRHLLARGDEPVAVVRPGGSRWRLANLDEHLRIVSVDLLDAAAVTEAVRTIRPEVIFHLAASGAYSWQTDLDAMLAVNVRATAAVLEGARAVGARVVNAGSSSEYGFRDAPAREADRLEPNSLYAVTKAAATHLCSLAAQSEDQPVVTLRLYSAYGPWEEPGRLMPTLVANAIRGGYPSLAAPDTARDFVWVGDICEAFVRAAGAAEEVAGSVLNLASGRQTTLRELVETARTVFGLPGEPVFGEMAGRVWDAAVWVGDPTHTEQLLGWRAHTPLAAGLGALADWIGEERDRLELYSPGQPTHLLAQAADRVKAVR